MWIWVCLGHLLKAFHNVYVTEWYYEILLLRKIEKRYILFEFPKSCEYVMVEQVLGCFFLCRLDKYIMYGKVFWIACAIIS